MSLFLAADGQRLKIAAERRHGGGGGGGGGLQKVAAVQFQCAEVDTAKQGCYN